MQTTAYEYVFAIAKHHSISKAARELCITQPALTKYLKRLEEDLGTQLFDRAVIPISLTPVSYTHLDVYKRQASRCSQWRLRRN